jgi:hypothetical protein
MQLDDDRTRITRPAQLGRARSARAAAGRGAVGRGSARAAAGRGAVGRGSARAAGRDDGDDKSGIRRLWPSPARTANNAGRRGALLRDRACAFQSVFVLIIFH